MCQPLYQCIFSSLQRVPVDQINEVQSNQESNPTPTTVFQPSQAESIVDHTSQTKHAFVQPASEVQTQQSQLKQASPKTKKDINVFPIGSVLTS